MSEAEPDTASDSHICQTKTTDNVSPAPPQYLLDVPPFSQLSSTITILLLTWPLFVASSSSA